jgi:chromosome segregation ATPase
MQDANFSVSTNRLNELLSAISDARQSLQNWQDQRTEAMIRLDSFAYDVQKIEEEKARLEQAVADSKKESENQQRLFQSQIQGLTDSLQMHKYEIEGFKHALVDKDISIEALKKEMESQKRMKDQLVEAHNKRLSEIESEYEKRHAQTLASEKLVQEGLSAELLEMSKRRSEADAKVEKFEREINYIRSNMIGLLNPKLLNPTSESKVQTEVDPFSETHTIRSTANSGASTVDDYLKRLGY